MLQAPPLVGRQEELGELRQHIARAAAGHGGLVLLGGEAGIGKTALLQAVLRDDEVLSVTGRCPGPGETPPFGPWLEAVAKLAERAGMDPTALPPPFGTAIAARDSEWSPPEQALALVSWLARPGRGPRRGPVIAVEDIHWADSASLELLRYMASRLPETAVLVIATYRSDEIHRTHPLWTLLPELQRAGADRLLLDRLTAGDVAELAAAVMPGAPGVHALARRLHARTGGHALFVRDLVLAAARAGSIPGEDEPLPETVQQAIDTRLMRLTPDQQTLLQAGAVIGEHFSYDLLARVVEASEDELVEALEAAMALHIIRSADGEQFVFDHALVREALVNRLIGPRRRRWHKLIAEALLGEAHPDPEAVALHLSRAGDPRAVEYLMSAGSRALRIAAAAQASEHFERALELMADTDPRRPELLLKLGQAFGLAGSERAMPYMEDALRAAEAAGDRPVVVWVHHMLASPAMNKRISLELMAELQAEQEAMLDHPRYQQLAVDLFGSFDGYPRIAFLRANGLLQQGCMKEARALIAELMGRIGDRPLPDELASLQRTIAFYEGRLADWLDLHHDFLVQSTRQKHSWREVDATFSLLAFQIRYQAEDPDVVDETARRYLRVEDQVRKWVGVGPLPDGYTSLGFYYFLRGDWQQAQHNLADVLQRHRLQRWSDLWARYWTAQLLLARGDLSGARTAYAPVHPLQPGDEADSVGPPVLLRCMRAWLHLAAGEMERAREWLEVTQRWLERVPDHPEQALVWTAWAEYCRSTGRLGVARDWAERALAAAGRVNYSLAMVRSLRLLGELDAATGAAPVAHAHFSAAQNLAERCRFPYEAALAQLARARALPGAPDTGGLAAARATFARLGAAPALAEADALLARSAAPAAREPAPAGHNLTEREVEVVRLVAQGLTDKEVAARMFISPKTVDGHLRNIFNKVGVSSRTALAAFAARHGMLGQGS